MHTKKLTAVRRRNFAALTTPLMRPLLLLLPLALPLATLAQTAPSPRHATVFDLTAASGGGLHSVAGAAWRLWGLDAGGRFQAGRAGRGIGPE